MIIFSDESKRNKLKKKPLDLCFQAIEDQNTLQNIGSLAILDSKPNFEEIKKNIKYRTQFYPRLSYSFGTSRDRFLIKIDDNIQLVKALNLEEALSYIQKEFHKNTTPWRIITGEDSLDESGLIDNKYENFIFFQLHHALGDGVSGLDFFHSISDLETKKTNKNLDTDIIQQEVKASIKWKYLIEIIKEGFKKRSNLKVNGVNSSKRKLLLISFPNRSLLKLKKTLKVTSFPILLAIASSIVSKISPENKSLEALIPVSMRGKNKVLDISNQIGGKSFKILLNNESFESRTSRINEDLLKVKQEDAYGTYLLFATILSYLPFKLRKRISTLAAHKTTMICTSLNGPNGTFSYGGARVLEEYAIPALMPGQGIGFGFLKTSGKMNIAIIYDPEIVSEEILTRSAVKCLDEISINNELNIRAI